MLYGPGLDFAVGAPYHGSGRVCVWMGGKDGVSPKPNQVRRLKLHISVELQNQPSAGLTDGLRMVRLKEG